MQITRSILVGSVALLATTTAQSQSAADIFESMESRQRASIDGISNYSQMKSTMGLCAIEHYEKDSVASVDGRGSVEYMRMLSPGEIAQRHSPDAAVSNMTPEQLDDVARRLSLMRPEVDAKFREEVSSAELPDGIGTMVMNPPPGKPWLSANPSDMLGMYATMLEGAADGKRDDKDRAAEAAEEASADRLATIAEQTSVVGREQVGDRDAIVLLSDGLNWTQAENGQSFTLNSLRLWVDADDFVPLRMRMEGVVDEGGNTRELRIEREDTAHQSGAGCGDFKVPHRSVMRISGVLSPAEEAEMAQAQAQLAEFKLQMDAMPAGQRDMIMRQMGPQMEMFEKMASGGGIEVISLVTGLRCDAGVPSPQDYAATMPGSAMSTCAGF